REYGDPQRALMLFRQMREEAERIGHSELRDWAAYAQADLAHEQGRIEDCLGLLGQISSTITEKEFLARLHLLKAKASASQQAESVSESLFADVEKECLQGHFREILWEVYHDWGLTRRKRREEAGAMSLLQQGVQVVQAIVSSLPEEYRDRYLNQRMRKQ